MISVLLFFLRASGVLAASKGKNSPLPADVIRVGSVLEFCKIILQNSKTEPTRITSAGRGEFFPLDAAKTPEARKKNRRTEIILTPKLDELLKVLGSN